MSWITIIWSIFGGTSLAMAGVYLLIWLNARDCWKNLFFSLSAAAAGSLALFEQALMHAQTAAQYGDVLRWMHLPAAVICVSLVWFLRLDLQSGRTWLVWLICGVRALVLVVNFVQEPNFNFQEITGLRQIVFWGELFSVPIGKQSPWAYLTRVSDLLILIFLVDASIASWGRGNRRRTVVMGGTVALAFVLAAVLSILMNRGVLPGPFVSVVFMLIVLLMASELSLEAQRASVFSRELRETQERMLLATDAAGLGLWDWDIVRDEIRSNTVSRARLGLGESEHIDFNRFLQALRPADREPTCKAIQRSLQNCGEFAAEYRIIAPDGTMRWIAAKGRVLCDHDGKPHLVRWVSMDITDRIQAEEERLQLQNELTHLGRLMTMSELSASLAHEINQPLGAILNNASAAQTIIAQRKEGDTGFQEILADIISDAMRASEIIQKIRGLVKKEDAIFERLNLNALIEDAIELYRSILNMEKILIFVELQPDLAPIRGDRVRLHQVFINLIGNANEAMRKSSTKTLTIRSIMQTPDRIVVSVGDSGTGFDDAMKDNVFQPFFTTKKDGLGMGLRISQSIIEEHGGRIWAENNPTHGATFYVSLNAHRGES